jgi:hypothetical protein
MLTPLDERLVEPEREPDDALLSCSGENRTPASQPLMIVLGLHATPPIRAL